MYLQNHIQLHIAEMHNKREEETGRSSDMHHLCLDLPPNRSTFVESRRRNRISAAINRWATIQHYDDSNFPSKGLATLSYNSSSPFSLLLPLLLPFATPPPPSPSHSPGLHNNSEIPETCRFFFHHSPLFISFSIAYSFFFFCSLFSLSTDN